MTEKRELPWWQKYTLTLNEASEYFGIGYKKLKLFVQEHSDADFVLWNGNRALIKREQFENIPTVRHWETPVREVTGRCC